jgi:hypothetical protein
LITTNRSLQPIYLKSQNGLSLHSGTVNASLFLDQIKKTFWANLVRNRPLMPNRFGVLDLT